MRLENILFEQANTGDLTIVNIDGCDDNSFDIELDNGETIECNDISDQFTELYRDGGVRIMSNESPYSALVDSAGSLKGGIVISYSLPEDIEEVEYGGGNVSFSIVVNPSVRGQKWAETMIADLVKNKSHSIIEAQVINPLMEKILVRMGFEKTSDSGNSKGLIYKLLPKRLRGKNDEDDRNAI